MPDRQSDKVVRIPNFRLGVRDSEFFVAEALSGDQCLTRNLENFHQIFQQEIFVYHPAVDHEQRKSI
jgi:hypothetical protein